jgi:hypothetical protein
MAKLGQDDDRAQAMCGAHDTFKGTFTGERPSAEFFFPLLRRVPIAGSPEFGSISLKR